MSQTVPDDYLKKLTELNIKEKELVRLKSENAILHNIITCLPGNVYWKDKAGRFLGCNKNVISLLGCTTLEEIVGKKNSDLFANRQLAVDIDLMDLEIYQSGKEKSFEEMGFNAERKPAIYITKKAPLLDGEGNAIGILGVSFDISDRKKMEEDLRLAKEQAETSNRAKSQFLAVVNHELRTPLTGIIGLINVLKQTNLNADEIKNKMEDLETCSKNLLNLVNDVLDFARLESGKIHLQSTTVNLKELIEEVFGILMNLAEQKGLALLVEFPENFPKNIFTDSRILQQIFINLINNAIKFTEKGFIKIKFFLLEQKKKKINLRIAIQDTGPGIPQDKLELIFEPFQQLENIYLRPSSRSGTGLGLSIVKGLATKLGMKLEVDSEIGKGSTFSLIGEFEIAQNDPDDLLTSDASEHLDAFPVKVLLVEDDRIVQYIHERMLTDLGFSVDTAASGLAALKKLNDHHIAFIDIGLSDITGFEVISEIRKQKKYAYMPLIALTGYTGDAEKQACLEAGANEMRTKPITSEHFKEIVSRYRDQMRRVQQFES